MSVLTLWGQTDSAPDTVNTQTSSTDEYKYNLVEISNSLDSSEECDSMGTDSSVDNMNSDDVLIEILKKITDKIKVGETKSITTWILLVISSLGFIIAVSSIVVIACINTKIKKRKEEIVKLEKLVSSLKKDLLALSNRFKPNVAKSTNAPQTINLSESPVEKTKPVVVTDKKEQKQPPRPVQEKSSVYYLFATAKAGSNYPEFYKVSRDKGLDKVYMLTLKNEEDEIAEFTIDPDMTPNFMKSVIDDRNTHLPKNFCVIEHYGEDPTRIEVVSNGTAKKEGGKWMVEKPMTIKLV